MAVVIRLMRAGAKKRPSYRVVAADSRRQRDGRFLEILGHYNPIAKPFELVLHKDRIEAWLAKGAQPSTQVASLLRVAGVKTSKAASKPKAKKAAASGTKVKKRTTARAVSPRKARAKVARKKKATARKTAAKKPA